MHQLLYGTGGRSCQEMSIGPFYVTQPNPTHLKWKNLDPTQYNKRAYSLVVTYFYTHNLSRTFSQPSINLFMFFADRALNALT